MADRNTHGGLDEVELLGVETTVRRSNVPALAVVALLAVGLAVLLLRPSGTVDQQPTAEVPSSDTSPTTTEPTSRAARSSLHDGPVLGEPTGFMLVIGSVDSDLRTLDLDSGVLEWSNATLFPRFVDGGRLVAVDNWGRWFQSPVADLAADAGAQPEPVAEFRPIVHLIDQPTTDGLVWARTPGREGRQVWRLVEVASNRVIDVVEVPADAYVPESPSGPLSGPDVVGSPGAGVFERTDEGYAQRHPGRLVAVGQQLLLVSTCDAALQCQLVWLDRTTFEPTDLPTPDVEAGDGFVVGDDSILVIEDRSGLIPVTVIVDIATGRTIRSAGETALDDVWISPDGRWLARPSYGEVQVRDLHNDSLHSIVGLHMGKDDRLIWALTDQALTRAPVYAEPSLAPLETPDIPASHPRHGTD